MKKYILSVAFLFAVLITPMAQVQAAGLKPEQVSAIVALLQSFGVDQSVINNVQTTLNGGATTQQSQPTYLSGCTSLAGFSTTTSFPCDGSTPAQDLGGSVTSVASPVASKNYVPVNPHANEVCSDGHTVAWESLNNVHVVVSPFPINPTCADYGVGVGSSTTYPSGCTSLVGYSTTTSFRCDGSTPSTPPTINTTKSSYTTSESLSGSIVGGDPNHTWSCIQRALNTDPAAQCISAPWRLLGSSIDIAAGSAGWNLVGGTLSLQALPLASFPPDTYTMYVRTGTSALDSSGPVSHASFTLTAAPSAVTSTVAGCENGHLYNTNTGVLCSTTPTTATYPPGCTSLVGYSTTTSLRCDGTTPAAVTLSAVHLTSISLSSLVTETVGTTATIHGSGFTGTNSVYMNGIQIDPATVKSSGPTPISISFVVPRYLPSCLDYERVCGPALTPGTYTISVQNTNGTSNSIGLSVYVFGIDGNGNGSPSGPGVGGGTGIGGALGTVIGTLTDAMAALSAAISGTPSLADTNVALANAMSNAEVALSEAHDSMSAANVAAAADAVAAAAAAADAAAAAGIASGIAANADAAAATAADAADGAAAAAAVGVGTE